MKLVDGRPTNQKIQNHGAFENQSIPEYDPRRNTYLRNCRRIETIFIDNTRTISINVSTSRSYVEIAKKELPMRAERDTSFCCPAVTGADEGIPLAGSGEPCTDGNPTASVRRTRRRIQSSGSVDDFLAWNPNSAGLLTMSTSVGQLSWRRYQTHAGVHGLGQDRARSAARSTGHTTAGGANLPPPGQGALEPRPGVSRSVDNLDARDAESTSRIDKEWKMVTVTMKEETIVIRQPASEVEMPPPPPSPENSSIRVENSIVWKLPLGSGRPIAV